MLINQASKMDGEIDNFIKVWTVAMVSLCYCYYVSSRIPTGLARLVSILPVMYIFITLPLSLYSFHLCGSTVLFLVWLANFKLLLFSFNQGPLLSLSLSHFIAIALLPIKTRTDPSRENAAGSPRPPQNPDIIRKRRQVKIRRFVIKLAVLITVIRLYRYRPHLHPKFIMVLYCCHMYLGVEFLLAITAVPVKAILGLELARQFNEPYLSTSLQDYWGRRWNLVVTDILRQTVYNPIRHICTPLVGRDWSLVPANLGTFLVSGLMHEVIFYYLSRESPTWEVTWFFVVQGICVTCEICAKKWLAGRWRLHRAVSGPLTVVFVGVTGGWLFFPQLVRYGLDLKAIEECYIMIHFVRDSFMRPILLLLWPNSGHSFD